MSKRFNKNRRRFLQQTLAGMAAFGVMSPTGRLSRVAMAAGQKTPTRRHLINIQAMGGIDQFWFYESFPEAHAQGFLESDGEVRDNVVEEFAGTELKYRTQFYTRRFQDTGFMTDFKDVSGETAFMGLGMKHVFGDTIGRDLIQNQMLLWRGLSKDSDHGIGNKLILHGGLSSYALSFSSVISQELAHEYQRSLHYVQLTPSPSSFASNWALARGAAVPINIDSYQTFKTLTRPTPADFQETATLDLITNAVRSLSGEMASSQLKLNSSKEVYSAFSNQFSTAVTLGTSNYAEGLPFKFIWKHYFLQALTKVQGLFDSSFSSQVTTTDPLTGAPWFSLERTGARQQLVELLARSYGGARIDVTYPFEEHWAPDDAKRYNMPAKTDLDANTSKLGDFITVCEAVLNRPKDADVNWPLKDAAGNAQSNWIASIYNTSFKFALADFLTRFNLSAVVDVPSPSSDAHEEGDMHVVANTIGFSLYRTLLQRLSRTWDHERGKHLIDMTTVAFWSELSRMPNAGGGGAGDLNQFRGTNHGQATSFLLAGYGVNRGKIMGNILSGPSGPYWSAYQSAIGAPPYVNPLPIDLKTGAVNMNGTVVNSKAIFPTMLKIFGIEVPANQVTEWAYIPAIIGKKS